MRSRRADRFEFNSIAEGFDTLTDFVRGAGGDALDIRDVLVGYQAGTLSNNNFVYLTRVPGTRS